MFLIYDLLMGSIAPMRRRKTVRLLRENASIGLELAKAEEPTREDKGADPTHSTAKKGNPPARRRAAELN